MAIEENVSTIRYKAKKRRNTDFEHQLDSIKPKLTKCN